MSVETVDASMGLPNTHVKLAHGGSAVEEYVVVGCTSSLRDLTLSTPSLLMHSEAVDLSFGTRMRLQLEEATSALELLQRLATEYDKHQPQHITACGAALFCCFCVSHNALPLFGAPARWRC